MSDPLISFDDVSFWYDSAKKIIEDFTWHIQAGQSWAIVGPSGSGKTTLLYLLAGIRQPVAGRVCYDRVPITQPHHNIGLMLQHYGLLPWYTAERNIRIGLEIRAVPAPEVRQRSDEWLKKLNIDHVRHQYPTQMSGGQRQRVALARLLALQASVLLLDEPLSAVDELTRERLQKRLDELRRSSGATTILVTHNIEEAVLLADHLLVITQYAPLSSFQALPTPFNGRSMPQRNDPYFIDFCQQIREIVGV